MKCIGSVIKQGSEEQEGGDVHYVLPNENNI